jgi:hypothetical protein
MIADAGKFAAHAELREGADRERAMREIHAYLRDGVGKEDLNTGHPARVRIVTAENTTIREYPERERDYWALVLAEMRGTNLCLRTSESFDCRDAKIDAFLKSIPGPIGNTTH